MSKYKKRRHFGRKVFNLFSDPPSPSRRKAEELKSAWAFEGMGYKPEFRIVRVKAGYLLYWR